VEAAGIEPPLESDSFAALFLQNPYTNHTPQRACECLIDTFRTLSEQNRDTFLQVVCAIYVQWHGLPPSIQSMIRNWTSLPEAVKGRVERMAEQLQLGDE
jgi:hypothetical protein